MAQNLLTPKWVHAALWAETGKKARSIFGTLGEGQFPEISMYFFNVFLK